MVCLEVVVSSQAQAQIKSEKERERERLHKACED